MELEEGGIENIKTTDKNCFDRFQTVRPDKQLYLWVHNEMWTSGEIFGKASEILPQSISVAKVLSKLRTISIQRTV